MRRALALLVSGAAIVASAGLVAGAQSESWPTLQGGADHLGQAAGAPEPALKLAWRAGPTGDARAGAVSLIAGLAVVVGRSTLVGLDPASGRHLWQVDRKTGPLNAAALDPTLGPHGTAVFTEGNGPGSSSVVAVDLTTHLREWTRPVSDLIQGSPTVEGGRVFVGSRDGYVYGLDALSGKVLWKTAIDGAGIASPAVAGGFVYEAGVDDSTGHVTLHALDAATGRSRWSFRQPGQGVRVSSVTVANGAVYEGFGDQVVRAFDAATGGLLWSRAVRGSFNHVGSLAFSGDSVYALDDVAGLYRLRAATGRVVWDYQFLPYATWGSPVVAGEHVFAGTDSGVIAAVDIRTGHLVWQWITALGPIGAPAPASGLLLVPVLGPGGGILAFAHDPAGPLIDEPSPTVLDLPTALANFAGAFLVMTVLLLGLFRFLVRPRRRQDAVPDGRTQP